MSDEEKQDGGCLKASFVSAEHQLIYLTARYLEGLTLVPILRKKGVGQQGGLSVGLVQLSCYGRSHLSVIPSSHLRPPASHQSADSSEDMRPVE